MESIQKPLAARELQTFKEQERQKSEVEYSKTRLDNIDKYTSGEITHEEFGRLQKINEHDKATLEKKLKAGSKDEIYRIEHEASIQRDALVKTNELRKKLEDAAFDYKLKREKDAFDHQEKSINKLHEFGLANIKRQFDYQNQLRSSQRESAFKMMDRQVEYKVAMGDTYGKSDAQIKDIKQDYKDDIDHEQRLQQIRESKMKALQQQEMDAAKREQEESQKLMDEQFKQRQELEDILFQERAKKEEELLKAELELRKAMMDAEFAYREAKTKHANEMEALDKQKREGKIDDQEYNRRKALADNNMKSASDKYDKDTAAASSKHLNKKQELAKLDAEQQRKRDKLKGKQERDTSSLESRLEMQSSREKMGIEESAEDASKAEERRHALNKGEKANERAARDRAIKRGVEEDNAAYDKQSKQRELRTTLQKTLISSDSAQDKRKAIMDYRADMQLEEQKSQIEAETRSRLDKAKQSGADERELNQIQKDSDAQLGALEDNAEIMKSMRDKLGSGMANVGQTEDLTATWERIQQSAFGHMSDPVTDAITTMDRNEAMRSSMMFNMCREWFPRLVQKPAGLAPD
jgi:hypothetical protein